MVRVGQGYDVHRLVTGRPLILGGVAIPGERGLAGHSDADVLLHAVTDALLGAVAAGDIGQWFPPTQDRWKGADSGELLKTVWQSPQLRDWELVNLDTTVIAEVPKLAPHIPAMRASVAELFDTTRDVISIKATTTEGLGTIGRKEGIAAWATVLLNRPQAENLTA